MPPRRAARPTTGGGSAPKQRFLPSTAFSDTGGVRFDPSAPDDARSAILASMSEKEFQRAVVKTLKRQGWRVFVVPDMRKTLAGLPDLLAIHARHHILLAWELKATKTRVTDMQLATLATLAFVPGVDARIVRPKDWDALRDAIWSADPVAALTAPTTAAGRGEGE
jgi:hypothetical protein